ncbi:MAG: DUF4886 domain-containing protein [Clostridia bacterium]|nr:DUF4886 domain-containing protein [Clostridia bacterium]
MKILSIGNSFSQDAHRYLHGVAKADEFNLKVVNLYIGGCTLRTHYLNMLDDVASYSFEFNGETTGIKVSIRQALVSDDWDYITLQQASPLSAKEETYFPYIEEIAKYVRKYCPKTKIVLHQTWAYENRSERLAQLGFETHEQMLENLSKAYENAALSIGADGIIPCGKVMYWAQKNGIKCVHRDSFHAAFGIGRYLLALTWYAFLTGNSIDENTFNDFDESVSRDEQEIAIQTINEIVKGKVL